MNKSFKQALISCFTVIFVCLLTLVGTSYACLLIQSQQKSISTSTQTLEVTENMQANGRSGAVQAELNGNITINADVYAVYTYGDGLSAAMAVSAGGNSKITINGGSFKTAHPAYTLVVLAGSSAKILVTGGNFYKYNPSNDPNGENAIFIADGYKVVQNGDWYTVVPE